MATGEIDPLVQYIRTYRGTPGGKSPDQWWNKEALDAYARNYINSLTPEQIVERYANYDPNQVSESFRQLYGGGYRLTPDEQYASLYKSIADTTGGEVDPNIMAQLIPAYQEGGAAGNAALAAWKNQYKQSTPYLRKQAPKYSGDVNQVFQDLMKRGATQGELDHFGQMLATGETDLYELSQYVQSLPEYQTAADQRFRTGLADELQGYDTKFFKQASPEILNQYAKAGIQNSSALDYALTDLMGNIASKRGEYLSGLSAQQYGGNKEAARQDYQSAMGNYLGNLDSQRQRNYGLIDYYNQRGDQRADYNLQRQDYLNYLNSMKSNKRGGAGSGLGSLIGAGIGAIGAGMVSGGMGAGEGAMLGAQLGGSGGGLYDYYN